MFRSKFWCSMKLILLITGQFAMSLIIFRCAGWLVVAFNFLNNMGKMYVPLGISTILLSKSVLSNIVGISTTHET